jgi:hypothetical protein
VTDITELLGFRNKSIMAGDTVQNIKVPNPSRLKLLALFVCCNFEISGAQLHMHYSSDGRGDVHSTAVHHNV